MADLPPLVCGGCRKCCIGDRVDLTSRDDPSQYRTTANDSGGRSLKRDAKGDCVYLGKRGCQIHARAPAMCKAFDCRQYALFIAQDTPSQREAKRHKASVQEGVRRLAELGIVVTL